MAQSALTVTPPNPSPPTNFTSTGATPPNPPNFTRGTYADWQDNTKFDTLPPPYYDDGSAGSLIVFAANTAALASGTSAADNNTGTTPGTNAAGAGGTGFNSVIGTYPGAAAGAVPASTSVAHEGAGTETLATWGVQWPTNASVYNPAGTPVMVGCGPAIPADAVGGRNINPNQAHPSTLSPATNPTLTSITPTTAVSGTGTTALTAVTGTGFNRQSVVYANGVPIPTVYSSATTLTATMPKKATSGPWPITVVTGGVVTTAAQTFTWT